MSSNIPLEELREIEAKCNALLALQEDYRHVVRSLEIKYNIPLREKRIRRIVGGGAGREEILLEENITIRSEAEERPRALP